MEMLQVVLIIVIFLFPPISFLIGYLIGTRKDFSHNQQTAMVVEEEICLHETAVVRTDGLSIEGSLLVCEKCGADYGHFGSGDRRIIKNI